LTQEASILIFVQKAKSIMDNLEVVSVVDLFLLQGSFSYFVPELLVVVLDFDKLVSQTEDHSLVHHYFAPPFLHDDTFELGVQQVNHLGAFYATVIAEGL